MTIKDNFEEVRSRIHEAERRAGRSEGSVKLMAVSKFHPAEAGQYKRFVICTGFV